MPTRGNSEAGVPTGVPEELMDADTDVEVLDGELVPRRFRPTGGGTPTAAETEHRPAAQ